MCCHIHLGVCGDGGAMGVKSRIYDTAQATINLALMCWYNPGTGGHVYYLAN